MTTEELADRIDAVAKDAAHHDHTRVALILAQLYIALHQPENVFQEYARAVNAVYEGVVVEREI